MPTPSYFSAHKYLQRCLGKASEFPCVDCGKEANEWSYEGGDPNELRDNNGTYSLDIELYAPRCYKCHQAFDRPNECKNGHPRTKENMYVQVHKDGRILTSCLTCRRDYAREYARRRRGINK